MAYGLDIALADQASCSNRAIAITVGWSTQVGIIAPSSNRMKAFPQCISAPPSKSQKLAMHPSALQPQSRGRPWERPLTSSNTSLSRLSPLVLHLLHHRTHIAASAAVADLLSNNFMLLLLRGVGRLLLF